MGQVLCPVLVGRDRELAELDAALQAARIGEGGLLVVSGEAGIGKSRLARALAERAEALGMTVGTGRAVAGAGLPLRPFAEALHAALRGQAPPSDSGLAPYRAVLGQFVREWAAERTQAAEPGMALLEGMQRLVRAMGASHGLLLVLEDMQWADADTMAALEHLADHGRSARVLCLCTERSGVAGEAADRLARLVARRAASRVPLGPLDDAQVAAMARSALGVLAAPPPLIGALRRRADGVPLLVEELLTAYLAAGGRPEGSAEWWVAESLPPSLRELVRGRLESLDPAAAQVVGAAAVLGRSFDWSLLGPIVTLDRGGVLRGLRAGVTAQLVVADNQRFWFRHALVREAVLAELLPPERAELCARAADVIEDRRPGLPGEWCERVAELREEAGDRLGACRLLQESARRALARGALASAESSLRRAQELARGDYVLWIGTDTLLCEVLARAGKTEDLVSLSRGLLAEWERAMRHAPGTSLARMLAAPRRAQIHLQAGHAAVVAGDAAMAAESMQNARRAAPQDPASLAHADALEAALAYRQGELARAASRAGTALAAAERLDLPEARREALEVLGQVAGARGDLTTMAEQFRRLLDAAGDGAPVWRIRAMAELGALDALCRGEAGQLEQAYAIAVDAGAISALAGIELELGWRRLGLAQLDEAARHIDAALDACRRFDLPALPDALVARGALCALRGRAKDMAEAAREAVAASGDRADVHAALRGESEAVLALTRDDRAAARAALDEAAAGVRWRRGAPWFLGLRDLLAAAAGEPPEGTARGHPVVDAYQEYAVAIALGRAGRPDEAAAAVARADALMPEGWRRHQARRVAAECALADGWGHPGAWLREAAGFFDAAGIPRIADACRRLSRRAGVPTRRAGRGAATVPPALRALGVTSREMDVLLLVGEGLSNAEIAERLFLSPRTVETHVKSLMRRSATTTRAQLVAFAARGAAVGSGI